MCFIKLISFLLKLLGWKSYEPMTSDVENETPVFFDLETTGLNTSTCDIVQLSAVCGHKSFNEFILPRCDVTAGATHVTGFWVSDGVLYLHQTPLSTSTHRPALVRFISFLKTINRPFLVAHNSRRFDWPILLRVLRESGLCEDFLKVVSGCVDTLSLSREMFHLEKYSQQFLVQHFLRQTYGAHDASEDARTLQDLYRVWKPSKDLEMKHKVFSHNILNKTHQF